MKGGQKLKLLEGTKGVTLGQPISNNLSPNGSDCPKSQFMPVYFRVHHGSSPPESFGMLIPVLQVSQPNVGSLPPVRPTSMILHFH